MVWAILLVLSVGYEGHRRKSEAKDDQIRTHRSYRPQAKTPPCQGCGIAVKHLLDLMSDSLAKGQRIEIRGFGSFSLHFRPPRIGRNPKTGEAVALSGKYVPHFKPGKDLRERVNSSRHFPIKS